MENTTNGNPANSGLPNEQTNGTEGKKIILTPTETDIFAETAPVKIITIDDITAAASDNDQSFADLPYQDPAITNPAELASFPKPAEKADAAEVEFESESRLVNRKSSPVREGRNIAQSDNRPDENGYI